LKYFAIAEEMSSDWLKPLSDRRPLSIGTGKIMSKSDAARCEWINASIIRMK